MYLYFLIEVGFAAVIVVILWTVLKRAGEEKRNKYT